MRKILMLFLMVCVILPCLQARAAEKTEKADTIWEMEISGERKLTSEEEERSRWIGVFANDIGSYLFDKKSLARVENKKDQIKVLGRTIFNSPEVLEQLQSQYKTKLPADDKVGFSDIQMIFNVEKRKYAVTETKLFSEHGILLEDIVAKEVLFKPVPVKTFADSMYEIAKLFNQNQ
ncbi:hypothetical protein [Sporomusa acidovorans]|uniref:Uncharacterized protein n=1 Tax=Sporomusa acidovorans (strain ATCC 49682 / DSM 3132 / Mol) TaxID=1123286 RepID=A0ABZ3J0W1_SPOA4|nr:hypothetical protein [Sporomusa acidovorans]OZC22773.1 hypothetical protein SPACI_10810 [Sporomusa acidovorans DSM 3132]SDE50557.1 hypothetical protein SAMN04488499_101517 [Sporomusa acidovorans]